ncbi:lipid-A-disaccharide synthase [Jannaschia donghaensis]|uniref:Lipid-A-disaccharide synthase n=1 Tax=Jannaschia donghaensis TaxID=420998 RepID=A0A0M6YK70_9RHOB|nr:lipid-A-disaccharide synthase [Jannaschia donghaensis]CTQ50761.1 Lipid-A-disaccharide synthase [Jannaschia donghaensis]
MTRIFVIAGEPSGDRLGAALMRGLQELEPGIAIDGIGGAEMIAEGLDSLFEMEILSVMGLTEVLPRLPDLLRRRDQAVAAIAQTGPDILVTIDSPDFCLRVASRAKAENPTLKVVHYVAPSVWAWREGRASKMARSVDHVLALLPFEPPYMKAAGMTCDFVGHPVVAEPQATAAEIAAFKTQHGDKIALVLPGSRQGEISRLGPMFGEALARIPRDARVVVPTVPHLADAVRDMVRSWPGDPVVLVDASEKRCAFGAATAALAASGTVSLELAASGTPMVIAYDMSWLSWQIISRMMKIDTVTLVNLVAEAKVVPEFLGPDCRPGPVGTAFARLLTVPSERERQAEALGRTMERLGRGGEAPGLRAAKSVLAQMPK